MLGYDTRFFLLIIWGFGGKELKYINKRAGFKIDKTLFKIDEKSLNLSKLNRYTIFSV